LNFPEIEFNDTEVNVRFAGACVGSPQVVAATPKVVVSSLFTLSKKKFK